MEKNHPTAKRSHAGSKHGKREKTPRMTIHLLEPNGTGKDETCVLPSTPVYQRKIDGWTTYQTTVMKYFGRRRRHCSGTIGMSATAPKILSRISFLPEQYYLGRLNTPMRLNKKVRALVRGTGWGSTWEPGWDATCKIQLDRALHLIPSACILRGSGQASN